MLAASGGTALHHLLSRVITDIQRLIGDIVRLSTVASIDLAKATGRVRPDQILFLRGRLVFSKIEGDAIFLTVIAAEGVTSWQRDLVFASVRVNTNQPRALPG